MFLADLNPLFASLHKQNSKPLLRETEPSHNTPEPAAEPSRRVQPTPRPLSNRRAESRAQSKCVTLYTLLCVYWLYVSHDVWYLYWLCVTWCLTPILTMCHVMSDTYTDYVSHDVWHLYWLCVTRCMTPILTMCHMMY